jgi:multiple sugar transport system permease protein
MPSRRTQTFYWSLEKGDLLPALLMVPAIGLVGFAMVVPSGLRSFPDPVRPPLRTFNPAESFVGLANYLRFFSDRTALQSVVNTLAFSAGAIAGDFILGTAMALLLHSLARLLSRWLRPMVTMPLLVSPIIVGLTWRYIYDPQGLLYWLLDKVGIPFEAFPVLPALPLR